MHEILQLFSVVIDTISEMLLNQLDFYWITFNKIYNIPLNMT